MKIFCTASQDTYITNKIIDGKLIADDANVGRAGTLDLFRLYGETTYRSSSNTRNELSRLLVKFDLTDARELTASILDLNHSSFSAKLKLYDIKSGHAVPANFNVIVFPLSHSFDEGVGRDVASFGDVDAANFLTRSYGSGAANLWYHSGANKPGLLGSDDIDIISSGNLQDGNGVINLFKTQNFKAGTEDLEIDVTNVVSATLAGILPDHGLRISFSGSEETDTKSRFVKRFASRHVSNPYLRPVIEIAFDDSMQDHHTSFFFDMSGSIFLQNYGRNDRKNIVSGSSLSEITGENCMKVKLKKGDYTFTADVSQHTRGTGGNNVAGLYSASFAIPSNTTTEYAKGKKLSDLISSEKKVTFDEYWYSTDGTVGYHTGSITVKVPERSTTSLTNFDPEVYATNLKQVYYKKDTEKIRLYGFDHANDFNVPAKTPIRRKSDIFENVYYRVRDRDSGRLIYDFGDEFNTTRVSTDSQGMFFDFKFKSLPTGRTYMFEYLIKMKGLRLVVQDNRNSFRVDE